MSDAYLLVFLGLISAMSPLSTDMYLPGLPELRADFGISPSLAQLTLTMTMAGMAVGQVAGGPLSDRFGRKKPLLFGMAGFLLMSAACFFSENIYAFLAFRFAQGFCGAFGIVISRAIARDVRSGAALLKFLSILMMVHGLAPVLAPVIGGQLLLFLPWRGVFAALAGVGAVLTVMTAVFRETLPSERRTGSLSGSFVSFAELLRDRYFLGHCLVQCFVFGGFFSYLAGSSFLFQNVYGVSPQTFSFIFGSIGLGLMAAGTLPAKMAGAVEGVTILKWALILPVAGSLLLLAGFLADAPIWYTVPVLFATIVPMSVMGAASTALSLSRQGKNAGSASALLGFFSMILGGACMPLVGIAGDHTAVPMGCLMAAGYGLALFTFFHMIAPFHRRGAAK